MANEITQEQAKNALQTIIEILVKALKEAGSVPSGVLYAQLMAYGMNLQQYQAIINGLKAKGWITEIHNVIYWKGGKP